MTMASNEVAPKSTLNLVIVASLWCIFLLATNYAFALSRHNRRQKQSSNEGNSLPPPEYPFFLPFVEPLFRLWWDHKGFVRRISSQTGQLTSNKISIWNRTFYTIQDRESVQKVFREPLLSSAIDMYGFVNANILGIPKKALQVYETDTSGPFPNPHPKSNVPPTRRIDFVTHSSLFKGLTGSALHPTTRRFVTDASRRLEQLNIGEEWTEFPDLSVFWGTIVGASALQSIIGPAMMNLHPTFVEDMFQFDAFFPDFGPGLPRFMLPQAHNLRDKLVNQFKTWYRYARANFDESMTFSDGDGDPIWGSNLMRQRQRTLLEVEHHDDEALARLDLGLSWSIIGNLVPSSMFSMFHIFKDEALLTRVRCELEKYLGNSSIEDADPIALSKAVPLLSSVYAETLRLYVKTYAIYSSPHEDIHLGKWILPKGGLAVMNSDPSHMDATFWNTQGGKHPVTSFWAERFLVDPEDPSTGPVSQACRKSSKSRRSSEPFFSTEGCEGAWIPFGGGHSMCPGRFFAKNVMIFMLALTTLRYDVDLSDAEVEFTKRRYGVGVEEIKNPLSFRVRKRQVEKL